VSYSIPPPEPQHTWVELLTVVGAIRRIAYLLSHTMDCDEQMRRIRDLFLDYDQPEGGDA
jgi:hypothetical protein